MLFKFAHILSQEGVLDEDVLIASFAKFNDEDDEHALTFDAFLCQEGLLTPKQANKYLAQTVDVEPVDLELLKEPTPEALKSLSSTTLKKYEIYPYSKEGGKLGMAVSLNVPWNQIQALNKKLNVTLEAVILSQIHLVQLRKKHLKVEPTKKLVTLSKDHALFGSQLFDPLAQFSMEADLGSLDAFGGLDLSSELPSLSQTSLPAVTAEVTETTDLKTTMEVAEELATPAPAEEQEPEAAPEAPAEALTLNLKQLDYLMDRVQTRDGLMELGLFFCANLMDQAAVLLLPKGKVVGHRLLHSDSNLEKAFTGISISLSSETIFKNIQETFVPYIGPIPKTKADQALFMLFYPEPKVVYFMPIRLKGRAVAILYGHRNEEPLTEDKFNELLHCNELMTAALEKVIVRFKKKKKEGGQQQAEDEMVADVIDALKRGDRAALEELLPAEVTKEEEEDDLDLLIDEPEILDPTGIAAEEVDESPQDIGTNTMELASAIPQSTDAGFDNFLDGSGLFDDIEEEQEGAVSTDEAPAAAAPDDTPDAEASDAPPDASKIIQKTTLTDTQDFSSLYQVHERTTVVQVEDDLNLNKD